MRTARRTRNLLHCIPFGGPVTISGWTTGLRSQRACSPITPAVLSVEFAGSRSRGTHAELSDWDFAVETSDFDALARDLPALVAPLKPLAQQWEPMGHFPVYQVLLRGPTKIEYLFLTRSQKPRPVLTPGPDTLAAINTTSGTGSGG